MKANDFRRIALSLAEAEEKSHFGKPDFRVRNRIFASLQADDRAVLKLTPEEQAVLTEPNHASSSQLGAVGDGMVGPRPTLRSPMR